MQEIISCKCAIRVCHLVLLYYGKNFIGRIQCCLSFDFSVMGFSFEIQMEQADLEGRGYVPSCNSVCGKDELD